MLLVGELAVYLGKGGAIVSPFCFCIFFFLIGFSFRFSFSNSFGNFWKERKTKLGGWGETGKSLEKEKM